MRQDAGLTECAAEMADPPKVCAPIALRPVSAAWIEAAYDSHARELWAVYYAECCDPDLAREALQEAFLRLHQQAPEGLRDIKAWLMRVGRNWLRDVARRRRRTARSAEFLDDLPGNHDDPLGRMEAAETQSHLRSCLARLRQDDRQVLVLRYALNWSSARMAEVLGISAAAVDMRLSRARKRLANLLHERDSPAPEEIDGDIR